jgi:hypothetical protein
VRAVRTVNLMAETEGKSAGLEPDGFRWLIRLDNDSANMSEPGGGGTQWLRKVSVEVPVVDKKTGNATIEKVGVVEAWSWPSKEDAAEAKEAAERKSLTPEIADAIIGAFVAAIRACRTGELRADVKAQTWAGKLVMPTVGLDPEDKGDRDRMDAWFKLLVASGDLVEIEDKDTNRHLRKYLDISDKTRRRFDEASEK